MQAVWKELLHHSVLQMLQIQSYDQILQEETMLC